MAQAAVATDVHQTFDVHLNSLAQVTFNLSLRFQDSADTTQLVFTQIPDTGIEIHASFFKNRIRSGTTNSVDISQPNLGPFIGWKINTSYTCHYNLFSKKLRFSKREFPPLGRRRNYPCRCLCFGLTQITRTTPLR